MMKKTILILVVLALLAPAGALAATEFSLGGFIKLNTFWDSTQLGYTPSGTAVIARNNDALFHHGNFNMSAQESRLSFTIKGPKLWGANTTGYFEMDFDGLGDNNFSSVTGAVAQPAVTNPFLPRLRQAMFRLNWPETELLLGQYWGMFSEYSPESTSDSAFTGHGFVNQRVPQVRVTQKFLGAWTTAFAVTKPHDPSANEVNFTGSLPAASFGTQLNTGLEGRSTEAPQLQGKLAFEQDLYGKAAFYGRPRGFVAQVTAGWQRIRFRNNFNTQVINGVIVNNPGVALNTFGQNAFGRTNVLQKEQQYMDPWIVQGTLFIPVIPTHSANLAGTASLTAQWWVGQGVSFVGGARDNDCSWLEFLGREPGTGNLYYARRLTNQFGGYVQGQYYFTNQWFLNLVWGMSRNFGFSQSRDFTAASATNPAGYVYASNNDQVKLWQEFEAVLWYRPIAALKFGLQYAYTRTDYLQKLNNPVPLPAVAQNQSPQPNTNAKDFGDGHRVSFAAFLYF